MFRFWKRKPKDCPDPEPADAEAEVQPTRVHAGCTSTPLKGFTPPEAAPDLILNGSAPPGLWTGKLSFESDEKLATLPQGLIARELSITQCPAFTDLPEDLWAQTVIIRDCPRFGSIPTSAAIEDLLLAGGCGTVKLAKDAAIGILRVEAFSGSLCFPERLRVNDFFWAESPFEELPAGLRVRGTLDLSGASNLIRLPQKMTLKALLLARCRSLSTLPTQLETDVLDISACVRLHWPEFAVIEVTDLILADCPQITYLPEWLTIKGSIDVAATGLTALPKSCATCQLRWRGVAVDERIAFHPEQIRVEEIFEQRNTELRRVMLERVGWERFLRETKPKVIDKDYDSGGKRRLLKVQFPDRALVVILCVSCPSTGRRYFLRVPPEIRWCHQAAAWIAGFDEPEEYQPILET